MPATISGPERISDYGITRSRRPVHTVCTLIVKLCRSIAFDSERDCKRPEAASNLTAKYRSISGFLSGARAEYLAKQHKFAQSRDAPIVIGETVRFSNYQNRIRENGVVASTHAI